MAQVPLCNGNKRGGECFREVESSQLPILLNVLKTRLPNSCLMHNQLLAYDAFKDDMNVFTFKEEDENSIGQYTSTDDTSSGLWIIIKFYRDDWGPCITISPPSVSEDAIVPTCVQRAFEAGKFIDWSKRFVVISVERYISDFLVKLNTRKFSNVIKIRPSNLFYMSPEDASKLEVSSDSSIKLRPLDAEKHTDFIATNWPYTLEGTESFIRKSIQSLPFGSAGVFLPNGELVCGAITTGYGALSTLVTPKNHRRKGYASLVVKHIFKELAKQGFHPSLNTEIRDHSAVTFHKSINPNIIAKVDYLSHEPF